MEPLKVTRAGYLYILFLDKETIICEDLMKQKGLYLGQQTKEELTKFVYTTFLALNSMAVVMRLLSIPLAQGAYLHVGAYLPPFKGKRVGSECGCLNNFP